jgi:hypothetical protein
MMVINYFPVVNTTFNELNSTGQISLIQNKELRTNIIEHYQNIDAREIRVNNNLNNVYYPHLFPTLKSSVLVNLNEFGFNSKIIKNNNHPQNLKDLVTNHLSQPSSSLDLINALSVRILISNISKSEVESSMQEAEILMEQINQELEN